MCNSLLYPRILDIFEPLKVRSDAAGFILCAYDEAWKTYHNASHILKMLELLDTLTKISPRSKQYVALMILYHDVWYKVGPMTSENEQRSAEWALRDLVKEKHDLKKAVRQGILATRSHNLDGVDREFSSEVAILLDLDLWGLGQPKERFNMDTEKVWGEFQCITTREKYDEGRSAWAKDFLTSRRKIYHTETFSHLEAQAKANLSALAGI